MSRVTQLKGTKGSLKWIQDVINECPILFNNTIHQAAGFEKWEAIEWLSPRADDEYSECSPGHSGARINLDKDRRTLELGGKAQSTSLTCRTCR